MPLLKGFRSHSQATFSFHNYLCSLKGTWKESSQKFLRQLTESWPNLSFESDLFKWIIWFSSQTNLKDLIVTHCKSFPPVPWSWCQWIKSDNQISMICEFSFVNWFIERLICEFVHKSRTFVCSSNKVWFSAQDLGQKSFRLLLQYFLWYLYGALSSFLKHLSSYSLFLHKKERPALKTPFFVCVFHRRKKVFRFGATWVTLSVLTP